jgi:hypothetical protein
MFLSDARHHLGDLLADYVLQAGQLFEGIVNQKTNNVPRSLILIEQHLTVGNAFDHVRE